MDAPLATIGVVLCMACGAMYGGISSTIDSWSYDQALEGRALYNLVDELGNPVSQDF